MPEGTDTAAGGDTAIPNFDRATLLALADRVEGASICDNSLDVQCEVALFIPDAVTVACRPNAAGYKVIYTTAIGSEQTHRADDWTMGDRRQLTAAALRARAALAPAVQGEG